MKYSFPKIISYADQYIAEILLIFQLNIYVFKNLKLSMSQNDFFHLILSSKKIDEWDYFYLVHEHETMKA